MIIKFMYSYTDRISLCLSGIVSPMKLSQKSFPFFFFFTVWKLKFDKNLDMFKTLSALSSHTLQISLNGPLSCTFIWVLVQFLFKECSS